VGKERKKGEKGLVVGDWGLGGLAFTVHVPPFKFSSSHRDARAAAAGAAGESEVGAAYPPSGYGYGFFVVQSINGKQMRPSIHNPCVEACFSSPAAASSPECADCCRRVRHVVPWNCDSQDNLQMGKLCCPPLMLLHDARFDQWEILYYSGLDNIRLRSAGLLKEAYLTLLVCLCVNVCFPLVSTAICVAASARRHLVVAVAATSERSRAPTAPPRLSAGLSK
jgi:hypothetical protein